MDQQLIDCATNQWCNHLKAKLHYASWFEPASKLVADRFETKFHYAIWFEPASNQVQTSSEPASNQIRTSFEPDSVMEFGREPASSC